MSIAAESRTPEKLPIPDRRQESSGISPSRQPSYFRQGRPAYSAASSKNPSSLQPQSQCLGSETSGTRKGKEKEQVPFATLKKKYFQDIAVLEEVLEKTQKKHAEYSSNVRSKPALGDNDAIIQDRSESVKVQYYQRQIENLRSIIKDLGSDSSSRDRINTLQKENEVIRSNYDKIRQAYVSMRRSEPTHSENSKLKETYDQLLSIHQATLLKLQRTQQENRKLKEQLRQSENNRRKVQQQGVKHSLERQQALQTQLREMRGKLQQLKLSATSVKRQSQFVADNAQLTRDLDKAKAELTKAKGKIEMLDDQLANAHTTISAYKSTIQHKNRQLQNALEELTKLKQFFIEMSIEGIESIAAPATAIQTQKLSNQNKSLRQTIIELRTQISTLKTDSQVLGSHVQLLKSEKQNLLEQVQQLKEAIQKYLRRETSSASREIEQQLLPEQSDPGLDDYSELENFKMSLKQFSDKLDRLCQQVLLLLTQLKKGLISLNSIS